MEVPYSKYSLVADSHLSLNKIKIMYRFPLLVVPGFPPSMWLHFSL
jgi:hypothetical protein